MVLEVTGAQAPLCMLGRSLFLIKVRKYGAIERDVAGISIFSFKIEKSRNISKFRSFTPQKVGYKIGKFRMAITPVSVVAEKIYAPR